MNLLEEILFKYPALTAAVGLGGFGLFMLILEGIARGTKGKER